MNTPNSTQKPPQPLIVAGQAEKPSRVLRTMEYRLQANARCTPRMSRDRIRAFYENHLAEEVVRLKVPDVDWRVIAVEAMRPLHHAEDRWHLRFDLWVAVIALENRPFLALAGEVGAQIQTTFLDQLRNEVRSGSGEILSINPAQIVRVQLTRKIETEWTPALERHREEVGSRHSCEVVMANSPLML